MVSVLVVFYISFSSISSQQVFYFAFRYLARRLIDLNYVHSLHGAEDGIDNGIRVYNYETGGVHDARAR
jgi:hypothetical protein